MTNVKGLNKSGKRYIIHKKKQSQRMVKKQKANTYAPKTVYNSKVKW